MSWYIRGWVKEKMDFIFYNTPYKQFIGRNFENTTEVWRCHLKFASRISSFFHIFYYVFRTKELNMVEITYLPQDYCFWDLLTYFERCEFALISDAISNFQRFLGGETNSPYKSRLFEISHNYCLQLAHHASGILVSEQYSVDIA